MKLKIIFSYLSTKTYVVGTQKNRLNETVLLSTQNTCLNFYLKKKVSLSETMIYYGISENKIEDISD